MQRNDLAGTLKTLKGSERPKRALESFYSLCGDPAANGPESWAGLAREERQHAEAIRRMAAMPAERPDRFEPNRAFQVTAIQTFIACVETFAGRLRTGEISRSDQHRLLSLARDPEHSALEGKWNEIVKAADTEFRRCSGRSSPRRWRTRRRSRRVWPSRRSPFEMASPPSRGLHNDSTGRVSAFALSGSRGVMSPHLDSGVAPPTLPE